MSTVHIPNLPRLGTLASAASWCNAAGRVDRSACVEVRAKWVRAWVEDWQWTPARTGSGRLATAVTFVWGDRLEAELKRRLPRRLAGDWRTCRAPAMRPQDWRPGVHALTRATGPVRKLPAGHKGFYVRVTGRKPLPYEDYGLDGNPNRGASRSKVLGVSKRWTCPVRLEKWTGNLGLPCYYLICAGGTPQTATCPSEREVRETHGLECFGIKEDAHGLESVGFGSEVARDGRLPGLSTVGRGLKKSGCPQRVQYLFLVLATAAEQRDAVAAQRWIASLPDRGLRGEQVMVQRLLDRYGVLFAPRRLLCRRCLGLRYGNQPEKIRVNAQRMLDRRAREREMRQRGPGTLAWVRGVRAAVGGTGSGVRGCKRVG